MARRQWTEAHIVELIKRAQGTPPAARPAPPEEDPDES